MDGRTRTGESFLGGLFGRDDYKQIVTTAASKLAAHLQRMAGAVKQVLVAG